MYAFVYRPPFCRVSWHIWIVELMKGDPNYFDILHTSAVLCWSIHSIGSACTNLFCYVLFWFIGASSALCSKH